METTDKYSCLALVDLLLAHGVENVVLSPGSRNLPLMVAVQRNSKLRSTVVVDERIAAFVALGMASASGRPVAIMCTSGTALLNYAPAVAEAYYKHVPLVVVSADRPYQWIDQDDSQTIRQYGVLDHIVKRSCDIPDVKPTDLDCWYAGRVINDVLVEMRRGCPGPVHINIQLNEPLSRMVECNMFPAPKLIKYEPIEETLMVDNLEALVSRVNHYSKVMVVAGFLSAGCAESLSNALNKFSRLPNVVVLTESISNLKINKAVQCIDIAVSGIPKDEAEDYAPDLLITVGGALVSRFVKQFLRTYSPIEHWHVGHTRVLVDCMQSMTLHVDMNPGRFFEALCGCLQTDGQISGYADLWSDLYASRCRQRDSFILDCGWSDIKAFSYILPAVPAEYNLQLSNGTSIRYAQLLADVTHVNSMDCNRGVSGIDGSTSTSIGAAMMYDGPTLLITGDMSTQYDMGALAVQNIPDRFKMIVINNSGGGIFRFISSTCAVAEREQLFREPVNLPLESLADAYGFKYYKASTGEELEDRLSEFFAFPYKAILEVCDLPTDESAAKLRELLRMNINK